MKLPKRLAKHGLALRLALGYGALIVTIVLVAVMGVRGMNSARSSYEQLLDGRVAELMRLQRLQLNLAQLNVFAREALLIDGEEQAKTLTEIESRRASIGDEITVLQKSLEDEGSDKAKQLAQKIGDNSSAILVSLIKFSRYLKAQKREPALAMMHDSLKPGLEKLKDFMDEAQVINAEHTAAVKSEVVYQQSNVQSRTLAVTLGASVMACLFAYFIIRSVTKPLRHATKTAQLMARGNFSKRLEVRSQDDVGLVIGAFNQISDGLTQLVGSIRTSANHVHETSQTIADDNVELENTANTQTQALKQSVSAIKQVETLVTQNLSTARSATNLAQEMGKAAELSSISVNEAVDEMVLINQSSQKISEIISIIDGIAFQTNILALNAAVEAARAGEMGRGFAVVAAEVRSLAGRSAQASKEINSLIHASQVYVQKGTTKVRSISTVINKVTQTASVLGNLVQQIAEGSQTQNQHLGEMVTSMQSLSSGTDVNLQTVQHMRRGIDNLRDMANALNQKVATFQIAEPVGGGYVLTAAPLPKLVAG